MPGVVECQLTPEVLEQLPEETQRPPWHCRIEGVLWLQRATPAAAEALPTQLRSRVGFPITLGAFVRYLESPVGPYSEILASPRLIRGGAVRSHVPFIAVDSIPSVHAGRAHWALPKVLAEFKGFPLAPRQPLEATGPGWWVRATAVPRGWTFPITLPLSGAQVRPDGNVAIFRSPVRARARLARVEVEVDPGSSMATWLRTGRHLGLFTTAGRVDLGRARVDRHGAGR